MRRSLALAFLLTIATQANAADWPQWLGLKRDGATTEIVKPWKEPLKILWKQPVGEGDGAPVIANGEVYLHTRTPGKYEESVAAFEADTGKPLWKTPYPRRKADFLYGSGPRGACCVAEGKVYTFGITGVLSCFDSDGGKLVWQVDIAKEYKAPTLFFGNSCSPLVEGDRVLFNVGAKGGVDRRLRYQNRQGNLEEARRQGQLFLAHRYWQRRHTPSDFPDGGRPGIALSQGRIPFLATSAQRQNQRKLDDSGAGRRHAIRRLDHGREYWPPPRKRRRQTCRQTNMEKTRN